MLRRLAREEPLRSLGRWEMRTVRSLLERGLVRPRPPGRTGREISGLWGLSAKGSRILPREPAGTGAAKARDASPLSPTAVAEMTR